MLERFCSQLYDLNIRYRYLGGKSLQKDKSLFHKKDTLDL